MACSAPVAVPAFVSLVQGALPSGSQVIISKALPVYNAGVLVQISDIRFTEDQIGELGPTYRHEEHFNIDCCLYNQGGMFADEPDQGALMTATYALYNDILVAIANNPTLGITGTIGFRIAWPRQLDYCNGVDIKGMAYGQLEFEVECQARSNSLT